MAALQLKKDDSAAAHRCPSCGAELPDGAVLCVQCGYDLRSGRRVDEEVAPRANPLVVAGVALLVAVAAGLAAWRILGSGPAPVTVIPAPVDTAPAAPAVTAEVAMVAAPAEPAPDAPATNTPEAAAMVPETVANEEPAAPALDPAVVEAGQRAAVTEQLDRMAPLYTAGDEIELRLTNGLVQRGRFVSRSEAALVVQVASNQNKTLDFVLLDRGSRVRSDPQFRARYIDFHTRQRTQKVLQQEAAAEELDKP